MSDPRLVREGAALARYLLGADPGPAVAERYASLAPTAPFASRQYDDFDHALARIALWHPLAARAADLHARFFRPTGLLRQRLVLTAAILENAPETAARLHRSGGGVWGAALAFAGAGLASLVLLLGGLIVFLPLRMVGGTPRTAR